MTEKLAELLGVAPGKRVRELEQYKSFMDSLNLSASLKVSLTKRFLSIVNECVESNRKLIIIRGIPGSGKSTFALQLRYIFIIVHGIYPMIAEADNYMGATFDSKRLQECHDKCQAATKTKLNNGGYVIVSNTSSTKAEVKPYIEMSFTAKTGMSIQQPPTPWKHNIDMCRKKCTKENIQLNIFERHLNNILKEV